MDGWSACPLNHPARIGDGDIAASPDFGRAQPRLDNDGLTQVSRLREPPLRPAGSIPPGTNPLLAASTPGPSLALTPERPWEFVPGPSPMPRAKTAREEPARRRQSGVPGSRGGRHRRGKGFGASPGGSRSPRRRSSCFTIGPARRPPRVCTAANCDGRWTPRIMGGDDAAQNAVGGCSCLSAVRARQGGPRGPGRHLAGQPESRVRRVSLQERAVWPDRVAAYPALRTAEMCGRMIVWDLTAAGPEQWNDGWFFDPENGETYNVSARVESNDRISARIYRGFSSSAVPKS